MKSKKNYKISWLGEFIDKPIEDEFLADSLSGSRKITALIALVFGAILGLFLVNSYLTEGGTPLFAKTAPIRLLFITVSIAVFLAARKITKYRQLVYIITFYQAMMATTYLFTLAQYDSLNYFSILALMVITLAIYLLPNKIIMSQAVTALFSLAFFISSGQKLAGMQTPELFRIVAYQAILLVYCNINFCWAEATKRKTFIANRELYDLSAKDPLTGIYNRKKFDDSLEEWMGLAQRYGNPLSIILFDIDNFKGVNDTYGHIVGDNVLKNVTASVCSSIRDTDVFARWGGDEFVILLPNTDLQQAEGIAERIRKSLRENCLDTVRNITCSFGVAELSERDTILSLLRRADDLLLQAKTSGKDRVVI